jgi:hypothetical protein
LEIGIYSFADITPDWRIERAISVEQRFAEIAAAAKLADASQARSAVDCKRDFIPTIIPSVLLTLDPGPAANGEMVTRHCTVARWSRAPVPWRWKTETPWHRALIFPRFNRATSPSGKDVPR